MNIEQIIANAPEGAERYWIWHDGDISYYKQSESGEKWHRMFSPSGDSLSNEWWASATYWEESTPLPKPAYSAENPPPDGWVGEIDLGSGKFYEAFMFDSLCYLKHDGFDLHKNHKLRETPTPRERFIEQAQLEGADFGAIYDEYIGGEV